MENEPIQNGKKGRDEKGRFTVGYEGGPGRPPNHLSITEEQQTYFREHPEEWKKYCKNIRKDKMMRGKMWDKFDPPQSDITSGGKPIVIQVAESLMKKYDSSDSSPESDPAG